VCAHRRRRRADRRRLARATRSHRSCIDLIASRRSLVWRRARRQVSAMLVLFTIFFVIFLA
jgi:hypothetical protein